MATKRGISFLYIPILALALAACSSTQNLTDRQYMLTQNIVKMEDVKDRRFDDLYYLLRPEPNIKFMGIFNLKTALYARYQDRQPFNPDSDLVNYKLHYAIWKAAKKNIPGHVNLYYRLENLIGEKLGEPPVLLDSGQIENSVTQLRIAMKKMGYFNAEIVPEVIFKKNNAHKAKVVYHVMANEPYFIREIHYQINIPEYRRMILFDTANCLVKVNQQYDENLLAQERARLLTLIRDKGYYYAPNEMIVIEVDTSLSTQWLAKKGSRSASIDILVNFDEVKNREIVKKATYKYQFNCVYIHTNYETQTDLSTPLDTVLFKSFRNKKDTTSYYFITPSASNKSKKNKIFRDYKYRTITDVIFTKSHKTYSKADFTRSYSRINALENFNIINISAAEAPELMDSTAKTGFLNTCYKLTRRKVHGTHFELAARTDKTNISFTYSNKNIFKSAERFTANIYGSIYYYDWLNNSEQKQIFGEIGGSIKLAYPRLFLFKQTQKLEALRYSTTIDVGANYSWRYYRLMLNANLTYNWSPNAHLSHIFIPIGIATIDTSIHTIRIVGNYPEEYRAKLRKQMIMSLRYVINYNYGIDYKNRRQVLKHGLDIYASIESAGMLLSGMNTLSNAIRKNNGIWIIAGYNYATYEIAELTLRYYYTINSDNSIAARFNAGVAIPLFHSKNIPFEKSFFLGGATSMRAWAFRALGPGSYSSTQGQDIQRVGDIKLEINLEYRGTIYKSVQYGIFADMGNVWLSRKYADMPGAEFDIKRFYKEIAIGVGFGLRIDFKFFLIRLDYGIPIYDPTRKEYNPWINNSWIKNKLWKWGHGFQFAVDHAF